MDKKKILFVDDVPMVLDGLKRMLRPMRREWDLHYAQSGAEALKILETALFNIVVSDMRMPGMDGAELLSEVKRLYPDTVRFVLSGHSEWEKMSNALGSMHQFLAKPCDADQLKATLARALQVQDMMADDRLKKVITRMNALPSFPRLYMELIQELRSEQASMVKIGGIIQKDAGMTAKILQIVNSAFFGIPVEITNITQAIGLIGLDTIKSLALSLQVFSQLDTANFDGFHPEALWSHSVQVAAAARKILKMESSDAKTVESGFLAGILHDAGKLALISNLPGEYRKVISLIREKGLRSFEAEEQVLGVSHAEIAGYLFGLWGMPHATIESILFHHKPGSLTGERLGPLTAVHVADAFLHGFHPGPEEAGPDLLDREYIMRLGIQDRLEAWHEACEQEIFERES